MNLLPLLKKASAKLVAKEFVSVVPLSAPSGITYYTESVDTHFQPHSIDPVLDTYMENINEMVKKELDL